MRPMRFPRRFPWLIALVLLAFSGVLFLPLGLWFWLAYPPVQHYYLGAYFESTFMGDHSTVAVPVRWLSKTAPGKKRELAMVADVVSDSTDNNLHLRMKLSPSARAEGWTGLVQGSPESVAADKLSPYLQETFFDGESAWRLLLQPVLWGAAAVLFLLAGGITIQERSRHEDRHGRRTKGPELLSALRSMYVAKADGIRFRLRFANWLLARLPFGPSCRIPRKLESSHILLMGDTGSGKSTAIRQILHQIQKRGESAIVYDPAMDFVGEFYDPKRGDLILNPLDARCPYWSLGSELVREETATTIAAAFLPEREHEREFFTDGPRRILAHLLKRKPQPRDILKWMRSHSTLPHQNRRMTIRRIVRTVQTGQTRTRIRPRRPKKAFSGTSPRALTRSKAPSALAELQRGKHGRRKIKGIRRNVWRSRAHGANRSKIISVSRGSMACELRRSQLTAPEIA